MDEVLQLKKKSFSLNKIVKSKGKESKKAPLKDYYANPL